MEIQLVNMAYDDHISLDLLSVYLHGNGIASTTNLVLKELI